LRSVSHAVAEAIATHGPDLDARRDEHFGIPEFILNA
jgi:hypothetical protein